MLDREAGTLQAFLELGAGEDPDQREHAEPPADGRDEPEPPHAVAEANRVADENPARPQHVVDPDDDGLLVFEQVQDAEREHGIDRFARNIDVLDGEGLEGHISNAGGGRLALRDPDHLVRYVRGADVAHVRRVGNRRRPGAAADLEHFHVRAKILAGLRQLALVRGFIADRFIRVAFRDAVPEFLRWRHRPSLYSAFDPDRQRAQSCLKCAARTRSER